MAAGVKVPGRKPGAWVDRRGSGPMVRLGGLLLGAFVLGGCVDLTVDDPFEVLPIDQVAFDPALGIDLADFQERPSGLWIRSDAAGVPPSASAGSEVEVGYTGWIPSGTSFGQSLEHDPIAFNLGVGQVILGFDEGVEGMTVGEVRTLLIPPYLGYAMNPPAGSGIPLNSWLIFQVDLVSVDGETGDPI